MRVRGRYLDDYFANDGSASRDGASMAARFGSIFFTASFDRRGCSPLFCRVNERNRNRGRIEESLRSFSIFEKVGRSMENPIYPPG